MKMIACVDQKTLALGNNGELLFTCEEDMKHFKSHTIGKVIVMGSKTYESMGGALKGRLNIVITSHPEKYNEKRDAIFLRLYQFLTVINIWGKNSDEIVVIGGGQIYKQLIDYCDTVYLTEVIRPDYDLLYDTDFPSEIRDTTKWKLHHRNGRPIEKPWIWKNENDEIETGKVYFSFATYKKVIDKNRRNGG